MSKRSDNAAGMPSNCASGDTGASGATLGRLVEAGRASAYAGAMLLYGYMERAGTGKVLASLPAGAARGYDAAGLMAAAVFGFALASSSAEGTKHLLAADAGALVGTEHFPHLRTLRPRLAARAEVADPLELQVVLAPGWKGSIPTGCATPRSPSWSSSAPTHGSSKNASGTPRGPPPWTPTATSSPLPTTA